jgi:hypothetical protein
MLTDRKNQRGLLQLQLATEFHHCRFVLHFRDRGDSTGYKD